MWFLAEFQFSFRFCRESTLQFVDFVDSFLLSSSYLCFPSLLKLSPSFHGGNTNSSTSTVQNNVITNPAQNQASKYYVMQRSLFIVWGYLGFMRRKLGFIHRSSLKNKQKTVFTRIWSCSKGGLTQQRLTSQMHGLMVHACAGASEATPHVRFRLFFRLRTSMNLKWIFFSLYCLQQPSKNPWSSISYHWSFTWCLDLSTYITLKTLLELHDLG